MPPLLLDPIPRLLPLPRTLNLRRHSANLDLLQRGRKIVIEREGIFVVNLPPRGMLLQYLEFGTRQRL